MAALSVSLITLAAVLLMMAGEAALSAFNERVLRERGAVETDAGIETMWWAYPASFVAMAVEGAITGPSTATVLPLGLALFGVSKALKIWSIRTLGIRWTFRILVLPDTPAVAHGPYAVMRHPNYAAILGEMAAVALIVWAPITGTIALVGYGALLRRKGAAEDRALGRQ